MKLTIGKAGPLQDVEADFSRPLMLLTGHNNTGKTLLSNLLNAGMKGRLRQLPDDFEQVNFSSPACAHSVLLPTERSAVATFLAEFRFLAEMAATEGTAAGMARLHRMQMRQRYPASIYTLIENMLGWTDRLENNEKPNQAGGELANWLEEHVWQGKLYAASGSLSFKSTTVTNTATPASGFPLSQSPAMVKALAALALCLRYGPKAPCLFLIDEPEASLHPTAQRQLARLLARMVNAGYRLLVNTHSDYLVRELNNLIMLSSALPEAAELRKKFGYAAEELLQPEQVGALHFTVAEHHTEVAQHNADATGLEIPAIDKEVHQLNDSSHQIYLSLF